MEYSALVTEHLFLRHLIYLHLCRAHSNPYINGQLSSVWEIPNIHVLYIIFLHSLCIFQAQPTYVTVHHTVIHKKNDSITVHVSYTPPPPPLSKLLYLLLLSVCEFVSITTLHTMGVRKYFTIASGWLEV